MKNKNLTIVIHGFFRNGPPGLSNNAKNSMKPTYNTHIDDTKIGIF